MTIRHIKLWHTILKSVTNLSHIILYHLRYAMLKYITLCYQDTMYYIVVYYAPFYCKFLHCSIIIHHVVLCHWNMLPCCSLLRYLIFSYYSMTYSSMISLTPHSEPPAGVEDLSRHGHTHGYDGCEICHPQFKSLKVQQRAVDVESWGLQGVALSSLGLFRTRRSLGLTKLRAEPTSRLKGNESLPNPLREPCPP